MFDFQHASQVNEQEKKEDNKTHNTHNRDKYIGENISYSSTVSMEKKNTILVEHLMSIYF
jgi:hypothetical protein